MIHSGCVYNEKQTARQHVKAKGKRRGNTLTWPIKVQHDRCHVAVNITPPAPYRLPAAPLVVGNVPCPKRLQLGHMPDGSHPWIPHTPSTLRYVV